MGYLTRNTTLLYSLAIFLYVIAGALFLLGYDASYVFNTVFLFLIAASIFHTAKLFIFYKNFITYDKVFVIGNYNRTSKYKIDYQYLLKYLPKPKDASDLHISILLGAKNHTSLDDKTIVVAEPIENYISATHNEYSLHHMSICVCLILLMFDILFSMISFLIAGNIFDLNIIFDENNIMFSKFSILAVIPAILSAFSYRLKTKLDEHCKTMQYDVFYNAHLHNK